MLFSNKVYWVIAADPAQKEIGAEADCNLCMLLKLAFTHDVLDKNGMEQCIAAAGPSS